MEINDGKSVDFGSGKQSRTTAKGPPTQIDQARSPNHADHLQSFEALKEMKGWSKVERNLFRLPIGAWDPTCACKRVSPTWLTTGTLK